MPPPTPPSTAPSIAPSVNPSLTPGTAPTIPPTAEYGPATIGYGWGPYAIANTFQYPVQFGYNGQGVTIAIVGAATPLQSTIAAYCQHFGIQPSCSYTTKSVDNRPATPVDQGGLGEATLDIETAIGLASGANVVLYAIPDLSGQSFINAFNAIIADQKAAGKPYVVSISFSGCETRGYTDTVERPIFQAGVRQGIVFVASSGDQGDECATGGTPQFTPGPNDPASIPEVTAAGGTESSSGGSSLIHNFPQLVANPIAWNDFLCGSGVQCATGGGVSGLFSIPPYQQGLNGEASTTMRNLPDVAMPAALDAVYGSGGWGLVLGTSWSAPEVAAMVAEIEEYCSNASPPNPPALFYTAFASAGYKDFIDVTAGNNQFGSDTMYYTAGTSFDNVSGIGLPYGMNVAQTLCPNRAPFYRGMTALSHTPSAMPGPAQPVVLAQASQIAGMRDLGMRQNTAIVRVTIVLRDTPMIATGEQAVIAALQRAGFTITHTYANHLVIDAQARSGTVQRYFATSIHDLAQPGYGMRYANVAPLTLPAEIAPYVSSVVADNLIRYQPLSHFLRGRF